MTASQLDEEVLFNAARQIGDGAARADYLRKAAGGDEGLLRRVEALLAVHEAPDRLLDRPPVVGGVTGGCDPALGDETAPVLPHECAGTQIGPYKLLQKIGEGGMGTVYMAEQTHPVQRKVALKVIKEGLNSRQVVARFEAERQALAVMDHANIARVFDGGATDNGRPYFVMELVHGVPITKYCDDNRLTPRERLELFVPVCQAIQHAHQKGVIHRDIKPSNVLVTLYDGRPVPKVIDFGVAKATEQKLTERTLFTQYGTLVGTLEYMSPEQAEMSALGVDTRSDVYSLGVLLYELLTGNTPLSHKTMKEAAYAEILRMIKEEEPPKPSARLSDSGEALASISAQRHMEPAKLTRLLRGELDWIVMKTLEKDRNRRYESAKDVARDVQRYLHDDPVEASPPSAFYRLGKFLRRNRGPALAAGLTVILLVAGIVGTSTGLKLASDRLTEVEAQKQRADDEVAVTRAVNEFLQNDLLGQADIGNQTGHGARDRSITVRELLDRAAQRIETRFDGQELTEAAIRRTIGKAYRAVGQYPEARIHLERSFALRAAKLGPAHADTLESMQDLAGLHASLGDHAKAELLYEPLLAARRAALGVDHPDTLQTMNDLGLLYSYQGQYEKAESLLQGTLRARSARLGADHLDTLETLHNLARLFWLQGRYAEAEPLSVQALAGLQIKLGLDHPHTLISMDALATLYYAWQRFDKAEPLFDQALATQRVKLGPDHPLTLNTMANLALLYQDTGRLEQAEALHRQVLAGRRAKLDANHPHLLMGMQNLATCYVVRKRYELAEPLFREVLAAQRAGLGAGHPDTIVTLSNLGALCRECSRYGEAEPLLLEALAEARRTLGFGHGTTRAIIAQLAALHRQEGRPYRTEPVLRDFVAFLRQHPGPQSTDYAQQLGLLAKNLLDQKKYVEAEPFARACLTIRARNSPDEWTTFDAQSVVGAAMLGQREYAEAEPFLVAGYDGMAQRRARMPPNAKARLTEALKRLVHLYDAWGKPEEAAKWRAKLPVEARIRDGLERDFAWPLLWGWPRG